MSLPPHIRESPEAVLSTLDKDGRRNWIYAVPSKGPWFRRRQVVGWLLIVVFFLMPTLKLGGKPLIFLDVLHREFTFFGLTLYATDTLLLLFFLIGTLVAVVLATALLGRAWCGWACPQTIYLEFVFRPIERLFEGKPSAQRRRDKRDPSLERYARKAGKWIAFTLVALVLAHNFVAYFVSWELLLGWMTGAPSEHWGVFVLMAGTTALILFDFGFFREQMCTIACPYARFQSVLLDPESLIVSYDSARGEPRGRRNKAQREQEKRGEPLSALGDCIDCKACVRTCPTGIDIRQGLQMECIGCTQCIDACDDIMASIGKPGGLVRYTSQRALEDQTSRVIRPRTVIYALIGLAAVAAFTATLNQRGGVDVEIVRAVGAPFVELPTGQISNRVKVRVHNRDQRKATFHLEVVEPAGTELRFVGPSKLELAPGSMDRLETWVVVPPSAFHDGEVLGQFRIVRDDGERVVDTYRLAGPLRLNGGS